MRLLERYYDDLEIGDRWESRRRTITETDVVSFCYLSGDWYVLHSDTVYAEKQGPFGGRIAHGYLVLSIASGLIVPPEPGPILANYGADRLRFTQPVRIGDTIRAELEVLGKTLKDDRKSGVVNVKVEVKNQNDQLVMVCVQKLLMAARSSTLA